ncbi:MAG: tyrosine-type recombinase/integrase [Ignavibacteriales bacterium]|nr:tyrosine-type recombinase/integrase [Ignavibacteriales bacterium]
MYLIKNKLSPYYQVIYLNGEKRTKISTKAIYKNDALKFLNEFENKITKKKLKPVIHLKTFQDEYVESISMVKSKAYIRSIKLSLKMLIDFIGNIELQKIDKRIIEKFISITFQRSESGASLYYRTLKAAFNNAECWGYIEYNPFKKFKPPKAKRNLPTFLTEDEFNLFISFVDNPLLKDFYTLLFYTGLRCGEAINLQLSDIDLTNRILHIRNKENFSTKSRKERIIPLNEIIFSIFLKKIPKIHHLNFNQYVFYRISSDVPLTVDYVSKQFKKCVRISGLNPQLHLHSLRHSFCSNLVNKNVSLFTVQQLAGHSSSKTTEIYSHMVNSSLRIAVDLLGNNLSIDQKIMEV